MQRQLVSERWQYNLQNYWDKQLIDLIAYGFHLDFDRNIVFQSTTENHKSELDSPQEIDKLSCILKQRFSMVHFSVSLVPCQ